MTQYFIRGNLSNTLGPINNTQAAILSNNCTFSKAIKWTHIGRRITIVNLSYQLISHSVRFSLSGTVAQVKISETLKVPNRIWGVVEHVRG